jgi:hypothetical protein
MAESANKTLGGEPRRQLGLRCSFEQPVEARCKKCRGWFDQQAFFRKKQDKRRLHISSRTYHAVCIGCETTARTERKKADYWLVKARATLRNHAKSYKNTVKEFTRLYGWDVPRLAHILKHAFDNTCPYCREPYASMPNSQWQVSMDVIDPTRPPFLETNAQPCCQTCNREKSNTPPELWARKLRAWAQWKAWQLTRPSGEQQLILFSDFRA